MNKAGKIRAKIYLLTTAAATLISLDACSRNVYQYSSLEIHIPEGINIQEGEIRERLSAVKLAGDNAFILRITVYGFSQGAEIINFSDGDTFSTKKGRAWIKALVQIKRGGEIAAAEFIEVSGNDRGELLDRFSSSVLETAGKER